MLMTKPAVTSMAPMMEVIRFPSLAQATDARGPDGRGTALFLRYAKTRFTNEGKWKLQIQGASILFIVGKPFQGCDFTVPTSTQGTVPCHSCKATQPSYSSEFLDAVSATEIGGTVWPRVRDGCYRDSRSTSWESDAGHDGANPADALGRATELVLQHHEEDPKSLQGPHHQHVHLIDSKQHKSKWQNYSAKWSIKIKFLEIRNRHNCRPIFCKRKSSLEVGTAVEDTPESSAEPPSSPILHLVAPCNTSSLLSWLLWSSSQTAWVWLLCPHWKHSDAHLTSMSTGKQSLDIPLYVSWQLTNLFF